MNGASGRAVAFIRWWSAVLAGALLILAVVAVNGHPTVFTDTDDYYALGKELVTDVGLGPPPPELSDADVAQAKIDKHMGLTQMASRSAVYSLFLYVTESAGTLWLVALVQGAAMARSAPRRAEMDRARRDRRRRRRLAAAVFRRLRDARCLRRHRRARGDPAAGIR
jgi:hypothetical protein